MSEGALLISESIIAYIEGRLNKGEKPSARELRLYYSARRILSRQDKAREGRIEENGISNNKERF